MRKPLLSLGPFAVVAVTVFSLLTLPIAGQKPEIESAGGRVPMFHDWTMRHILTPRFGPMSAMLAAQRDPRAQFGWQRRFGWGRPGRWPLPPSSARPRGEAVQRDWSIYLGSSGTAPAMYPAKFSFDVTATPSCANDFVVFPIAANGSATQPNIVAFNQLYSGTAGTAGICNRTATASDSGVAAEVYWSYNVQGIAAGGAVTTSPVLSYDSAGATTGAKVAFVESGSASAHFHVLAWKANDGQSATNLQSVGLGEVASVSIAAKGSGYHNGDTVTIVQGSDTTATCTVTVTGGVVTALTLTAAGTGYTAAKGVATTGGKGTQLTVDISARSPSQITSSSFVTSAPAPGSGTATDLAFGSSSDTLSSPFPDYQHDTVYVGNDAGQLYRIKDVFCVGADDTNPDCKSASPAPSIDTSWGTLGGGFTQVCSGKLTGPTVDFVTFNVYVGCADGKLYELSSQGRVLASIQVGNGTTYGGIVDPPEVDSVDGFVYAVSGTGSANTGAGVLVQAKADLSSSVAVPIGTGNQCNLHNGTPSNAFFTSPTAPGALMYVAATTGAVGQCSASTTAGALELYGITFGANGVMTSGNPKNAINVGNRGNEWAPLIEFYNATAGIDYLFGSVIVTPPDLASFTITSAFPAGGYTILGNEGIGTSGIVVDNDSSSAQASSFYFNARGENAACNNTTLLTDTGGCAVKLTQGALN